MKQLDIVGCPNSEACNLIKKETLAQVFSCEFCEIPKNTFFTEHFRWLLMNIKLSRPSEVFLRTAALEYKHLIGIIVDQRAGCLVSNNHFGRDAKEVI